jgi:opacity protein-like surface antigen
MNPLHLGTPRLALASLTLLLGGCAATGPAAQTEAALPPSGWRQAPQVEPQAAAHPFDSRATLDLLVGVHSTDRGNADEFGLEDPVVIGVQLGYDVDPRGWFGVEGGLAAGGDEGRGTVTVEGETVTRDVDGEAVEVSLGLRTAPHFPLGPDARLVPFVGAGLAFVSAGAAYELDVGDLVDSDDDLGWYARCGIAVEVGQGWRFGLEYRLLEGTEFDLFGTETDLDGDRIALFAGVRL